MTGQLEQWIPEITNLIVRWMHVIAGIMWIGSSIFFNWMDSSLEKPDESEKGTLEGRLWMVHSGGFYEVEKKNVLPEVMPRHLHWFKWEAGFTLITGWFLLVVVYWLGGAVLMVDPNISGISPGAAVGVALGLLVGGWFVYDVLWQTLGKKSEPAALVVSVLLLLLAIYFMAHTFSGRAAFLHTGALMGTCMAVNVWVRIIPAQRGLVDAVVSGRGRDAHLEGLAKSAKRRSRHNNYMTYPVIFAMLSNHFPSLYGHAWNWVLLVVLFVLSMLVRHAQNTRDLPAAVTFIPLGVLAALWCVPPALSALEPKPAPTVAAVATGVAVDAATAGRIRGVVRYEGPVPEPRLVNFMAGCEQGKDGPVPLQDVLVAGGNVAEVFVHVKGGVPGADVGPVPTEPVVVDQQGCIYVPRVLGARVGQPVTFVNSDPFFHNVRAVAKSNETWSINMPAKNMRETKVFRSPEVMVQTRCDLHPWMTAHVGVVDHPWFAVTAADGAFALPPLPPGRYALEAWHVALGRAEAVVEVPARGDVAVTLTLNAPAAAQP